MQAQKLLRFAKQFMGWLKNLPQYFINYNKVRLSKVYTIFDYL